MLDGHSISDRRSSEGSLCYGTSVWHPLYTYVQVYQKVPVC
jgi:hypothetical protein